MYQTPTVLTCDINHGNMATVSRKTEQKEGWKDGRKDGRNSNDHKNPSVTIHYKNS